MTPILFSGPMVRAILEGRKTETRRVMRPQPQQRPDGGWEWGRGSRRIGLLAVERAHPEWVAGCPYGEPGEHLWVRETWADIGERGSPAYVYRASTPGGERVRVDAPWRPSIFMPRAASRITLRVAEVRAERLQEITPEAILAEGIADDRWSRQAITERGITAEIAAGLRSRWERAWNEINGHHAPWDANPWVWVVRFEVLDGR